MPTKRRLEKIKQVVSLRQKGVVVVLEDIHDPHNAQAVFRTCEAFGIQDIYLIFENEKPFNPRRIGKRSSASANKWLDFKKFNSTEKCLKTLSRQGYKIIATTADSASDIFHSKFKASKIALLLGNEHRGLSNSAIRLADQKVTIPMRGMVQSLNLSVSAAIFIYEISRQRRPMKTMPRSAEKRLLKNFLKKA